MNSPDNNERIVSSKDLQMRIIYSFCAICGVYILFTSIIPYLKGVVVLYFEKKNALAKVKAKLATLSYDVVGQENLQEMASLVRKEEEEQEEVSTMTSEEPTRFRLRMPPPSDLTLRHDSSRSRIERQRQKSNKEEITPDDEPGEAASSNLTTDKKPQAEVQVDREREAETVSNSRRIRRTPNFSLQSPTSTSTGITGSSYGDTISSNGGTGTIGTNGITGSTGTRGGTGTTNIGTNGITGSTRGGTGSWRAPLPTTAVEIGRGSTASDMNRSAGGNHNTRATTRDVIRLQQDQEYAKGLAKDLEMQQEKQRNDRLQREYDARSREKEIKFDTYPPEPEEEKEGVVTLSFRIQIIIHDEDHNSTNITTANYKIGNSSVPSAATTRAAAAGGVGGGGGGGSNATMTKLKRRFRITDTLLDVFEFLECQPICPLDYNSLELSLSYPKITLTRVDAAKTLEMLNITSHSVMWVHITTA